MHIGRNPRLSERCNVPREPMFSLADFAERKKLEYRSLVACMNGSAARPTPSTDVMKTCRSVGGSPFRQSKHLYRLQDLETWLDQHGAKVKRVIPAGVVA